jgi:plastocyanin
MTTRRGFLTAGGLALAGLAAPQVLRAAPRVVEIHMRATDRGEHVWFDPIGVYVERGTTVRWIVDRDVHTTTAYHPSNDGHSLRIPKDARPWDSKFLMEKGAHFDVTLSVDGVYDYYCMPHEEAGMVGRIVVGKPGGPGALPFDYFKGQAASASWKAVPLAAQRAFPSVASIMKERVVRRPASQTSSSHSNHTG